MLANKLTPVSPGRNGKQNKWSDLKDFHLLIHKLEWLTVGITPIISTLQGKFLFIKNKTKQVFII